VGGALRAATEHVPEVAAEDSASHVQHFSEAILLRVIKIAIW
jgi:hypothetical protein